PQTLYEKFSNAFAYYKQVSLCNPHPNRQQLMKDCNLAWKQIKKENKTVIDEKIHSYFNSIPSHVYCHQSKFTSRNMNNSGSSSLPNNISVIHTSLQCEDELPKNAVSQRDAFQKITAVTKKISEYEQMYLISTDESFKETLLKRHAQAQARLEDKKAKMLEEGIVEKYDGPGRPSAAMIHPDFWDKIHDCIEFGAAHKKKKKKPRHPNIFAARHHHHPAR
ncbi:20078_t:CDS:2, partial [Dentiscutata erythropus]